MDLQVFFFSSKKNQVFFFSSKKSKFSFSVPKKSSFLFQFQKKQVSFSVPKKAKSFFSSKEINSFLFQLRKASFQFQFQKETKKKVPFSSFKKPASFLFQFLNTFTFLFHSFLLQKVHASFLPVSHLTSKKIPPSQFPYLLLKKDMFQFSLWKTTDFITTYVQTK